MENELIKSLVSIVAFFNRTDRDKKFVKAAGIDLEATSFQLFVTIGRMQPTNVSDLANIMGKSHSSVSRQIDKLENSGLIVTRNAEKDARIRTIQLSKQGTELTQTIDVTRLKEIKNIMSSWSDEEKKSLLVNLQHLARTLNSLE